MILRVAKSSQRIAQLDGWRGISIAAVVAGHLITRRYSAHPDFTVPGIAVVFSSWGVDIFFVISGFIITTLALREYDTNGHFSIRDFYIRRFFRIVPPFAAYLGFLILANAYSLIKQPYSDTLTAAAFACNFPNAQCGWFASHTWTLAYEEQFYILFPLLFAPIGRSAGKILAILFVVLIVFPFARFVLHLNDDWRAVAGFAPSFSFICAGAVAAAYTDRMARFMASGAARYISFGVASILGGLLFLDATFEFSLGSQLAYMQVSFDNILLPVGIAWLVVSSIYQSSFFTRMLTARPLLFLGMISYSLYLWQQLFAGAPAYYISEGFLASPPVMLIVAALSYFFIERPAVRLGKRILATLAKRTPKPKQGGIDVLRA